MELNIVPLKDLCNDYKKDIVDGPFGANLKREHYKDEGIPVLKIQNIKSFNITLKKMDYVDEEKFYELRRHNYLSGDIVMTKLGNPLGESAIVEGIDEGLIVADLVRIRAQKIDTKYLCYHLNSPITSDYINSQQKGTTRPRVRIAVVRDLPIYTPPIPEQQRIVAILDQAFADIEKARANAEKNLKNARELFDSYLNQVFSQRGEGWVENKLGDVCDLQNGYAFKSGDYIAHSNTLNIRMSNIRPSGLFDANHNIRYLPESYAQKYSSFLLKEGDLIIAMTDMAGDPKILGLPTLVQDPSGYKMLMNQRVGKLCEFSSEIHVPYLCHYLSSPIMKEFYKSKGAGGLQLNISKKDILSASIPLPPIPEQQCIVDLVNKLSNKVQQLEKGYQEKLNSLDELKKSLLQKAFSGELTQTEGMVA